MSLSPWAWQKTRMRRPSDRRRNSKRPAPSCFPNCVPHTATPRCCRISRIAAPIDRRCSPVSERSHSRTGWPPSACS